LTPNGAPTSAPIPPEVLTIQREKSKLENIKQVKSTGKKMTSSSSTAQSNANVTASPASGAGGQTAPTTPTKAASAQSAASPTKKEKPASVLPSPADKPTTTSEVYSTEEELILNDNDMPVSFTGVSTDTEAELDDDGSKFNGNDNSTSFFNGHASDKAINSVIKAAQATHANGGSNGKCARYTYNIARNYVQGLNGKQMTKGANFSAGGNANGRGYFESLKNLGYDVNIGGKEISKSELQSILNRDFDIGDVVAYWAVDGSAADPSKKYGHTQLFTGGLHSGSGGHKWITDHISNYRTYFPYSSKSSAKWNLLIFKAPVA
jgi:hypothetical protein